MSSWGTVAAVARDTPEPAQYPGRFTAALAQCRDVVVGGLDLVGDGVEVGLCENAAGGDAVRSGYHQASKDRRSVVTAGSERGNQASSRPPPAAAERLATPSSPASEAAAPMGWQTLWATTLPSLSSG